jgi:thioredoxin 1
MAAHFSDENFQDEVLKSMIPVLVDFYAEWCGPCKMLAPTIEKLAKEYDGKFKVGKLDVDANQKISGAMGIQSIPTLVFFKDGKIVDHAMGFKSEEDLRKRMETILK